MSSRMDRRMKMRYRGAFKPGAEHPKYSHGMYGTRTYWSWTMMKQRCTNPKATSWLEYGGRGVSVCSRWLHSFENFLKDMGERPEGKTLDRINGRGNYTPKNCRWATPLEQANNHRDSYLHNNSKRMPLQNVPNTDGIYWNSTKLCQ